MVRYRRKVTHAMFMKRATVLTVIFSMCLGYYFIGCGRGIGPVLGRFNKTVSAKFNINDREFYRIEGLDETNNVNMFWDMSSLKSFTSIIPGSTFEMYDLLGITRTVNSAPDLDRYALRALSRVKYIMVPQDMTKMDDAIVNLRIYYKIDTQGIYDIYQTDYALPMGFAYDGYYLEKDVKDNVKVDNLMVRAAILNEEQAEKYSDILEKLDDISLGQVSYQQFRKDAEARISEGVTQFTINKQGFTAVSKYNTEKLVCFSVPWCKGWSATVNGRPVEVDKINGGLCAIRVPKGSVKISFTYETPGLRYGIIAMFAGIILLGGYMFYFRFRREKGHSYVHLYDLDQVDGVKAYRSYVGQISAQIHSYPELVGKFSSDSQAIKLPNISESVIDTEKYDFGEQALKKRDHHMSEDDEAYRIIAELDKKKENHEAYRIIEELDRQNEDGELYLVMDELDKQDEDDNE